ncbi:hypothetical protein DFJ73DRAFT_858958 [Zopfochytrium polystomum]|nr:hypothetical protein DFJ73DRAFT_858958 [Zopfochytrium polystomum]
MVDSSYETSSRIARYFRNRWRLAFPVVELRYVRVLNEILQKPNWWIKRRDPALWERWRTEATAVFRDIKNPLESNHNDAEPVDWDLLREELDYIESTLLLHRAPADPALYSAAATPAMSTITPTAVHGVHHSDDLLSPGLLARLRDLARPLEAAAFAAGSWHPGSDGQVLNLVHPSPHALVFGRSLSSTLPNVLVGETVIPAPPKANGGDASEKFQWLPSDVVVDADGRAKIDSYINNLHPERHAALYDALARCFEAMLPMFERALGSLTTEPFHRMAIDTRELQPKVEKRDWIRVQFAKYIGKSVEEIQDPQYDDDLNAFKERFSKKDFALRMEYTPTMRDFERWKVPRSEDVSEQETRNANLLRNRWVYPSDPRVAKDGVRPEMVRAALLGGLETTHCARELKDCRLQVIFKMTNIHLTPEKPDYPGGSWHIEGMENECIAATGLIYYDVENITESRLSFRNVFDDGNWSYGQDDYEYLQYLFGFENENSKPLQSTGSAVARGGRCVVFPNFLHHKLEPFSLQDRTRPGHRKMLAFFLVHPDAGPGVYSTRFVPPQQREWVASLLKEVLPRQIPNEIVESIMKRLGTVMTADEANRFQAEISEERKITREGEFADIYEIFLCEH